ERGADRRAVEGPDHLHDEVVDEEASELGVRDHALALGLPARPPRAPGLEDRALPRRELRGRDDAPRAGSRLRRARAAGREEDEERGAGLPHPRFRYRASTASRWASKVGGGSAGGASAPSLAGSARIASSFAAR